MTKSYKPVRVYKETDMKINDLINELSYQEKKNVSKPELLRRTFNIPTLKDYLKIDSKLFKAKGGFK